MMKIPFILAATSVLATVTLNSSSDAAPIDLSTATPAQSTQLGDFGAGNALDNIVNFTHTQSSDENPTWQAFLSDSYSFDSVTVFNRGSSEGTLSCCPSRLRDITVQIVDFSGDVNSDFSGGVVTFGSELLNPENVIGGGVASSGPVSLTVSPGGAVGNLIRVLRTVDPDLSGTGGDGNADEGSVLSLDLVVAEGTLVPEPSGVLLALLGLVSLGFFRRR